MEGVGVEEEERGSVCRPQRWWQEKGEGQRWWLIKERMSDHASSICLSETAEVADWDI